MNIIDRILNAISPPPLTMSTTEKAGPPKKSSGELKEEVRQLIVDLRNLLCDIKYALELEPQHGLNFFFSKMTDMDSARLKKLKMSVRGVNERWGEHSASTISVIEGHLDGVWISELAGCYHEGPSGTQIPKDKLRQLMEKTRDDLFKGIRELEDCVGS